MSKYQELKDAALAAASKYRETGSLEDRDALDKAEEKLHAYESGAAELIERAQKVLFGIVSQCSGCRCTCMFRCEMLKLIEEMDTLTKGGAK